VTRGRDDTSGLAKDVRCANGCGTANAARHWKRDRSRPQGEELVVKAKVGDKLIEEGTDVGDHRRIGIITALRHDDGTPPYMVRWLDTGHEGLVYPGPDAHLEQSRAPDSQ